MDEWLRQALGLQGEARPYPWQEELLRRFLQGRIEPVIDIPTGLGKTAVMAIWLVARAWGAPVPRRLVYIVDRRVIVDQATEVAEGLRSFVAERPELGARLGLKPSEALPISTLRGKYVDNREWLEDPSAAALIVGTVDMVGSRLLFQGYGVSRKMRPYQAGLLGVDSLLVLDEAHLVPPFEHLLRFVVQDPSLAPVADLRSVIPASRLMALSATAPRGEGEPPFGLQAADLEDPGVQRRLTAVKRLVRIDLGEAKLPATLAAEAWRLAAGGAPRVRCIVFSDRRETAQQAQLELETLAKASGCPVQTELLVGGRRVFERGDAQSRLAKLGFLRGRQAAGSDTHSAAVVEPALAFLFATSAGEVGIDLDADCLVCDVVAWERMVQRFGRVNRRGDRSAKVSLIVEADPSGVNELLAKPSAELKAKQRDLVKRVLRQRAVLALVERLPASADGRDVSPGALRDLALAARADAGLRRLITCASTPAPMRPAATRALVDAWALTSLPAHPGRPAVAPWLRGWVEAEPETNVVWRRHLPSRAARDRRDGGRPPTGAAAGASDKGVEAFFEAAPPHTSEILQTETYRVTKWLAARGSALLVAARKPAANAGEKTLTADDVAGWVLRPDGEPVDLRLGQLAVIPEQSSDERLDLDDLLVGATLVVDARLGGLEHGLLGNQDGVVQTADDGETCWIDEGVVGFRIRTTDEELDADGAWHERARFAAEWSDEGEPQGWLIVDRWRSDAATEDDRSADKRQGLDEHQLAVEARALEIAERLALPTAYRQMLGAVARRHDEGKRTARWQRAFRAPQDELCAKTPGPVNTQLLAGYRHEFGSLGLALRDGLLDGQPEALQALALHLIAAHHGYGRPLIPTSGSDDAPPSALRQRAAEVALRFARLQARWGPFGLAWWEALLRAADQQASREVSARDRAAGPVGG